MLASTEHGCLLIADISGYTGYLAGSELDHAHDILADLMGTIVTSLKPMLRLAKLEGDAAFVYAPHGKVAGSVLLDVVERCYDAFRRRLRDIKRATSCPCNACRQIPSLNLKAFAHVGEFIRHRIAGHEELSGTDVILVHHLLKNSIAEKFGLHGYALFTEACVHSLGVDPAGLGMQEHTEAYEHIGEVRTYVYDLQPRWEQEQERARAYVAPGEADGETSFTFSAPRELVWEYLTAPEKRMRYTPGVTDFKQTNPKGRRGVGSVNHCVHGADAIVEKILDWRPFDYLTVRFEAFGLTLQETLELQPAGEGTTVILRVTVPRTKKARDMWSSMGSQYTGVMHQIFSRMAEVIAEDAADRTPVS